MLNASKETRQHIRDRVMTEEDMKREIAECASEADAARKLFEALGWQNTPRDPAEREQSRQRYEQAKADMMRAESRLRRAQAKYANS